MELKNEIEMLFEEFKPDANNEEKVIKAGLTLWVPEEYKSKFDVLQELTGRRFGKLLQEVVKKSIDKIDTKKL